jgi:hypothetical protein
VTDEERSPDNHPTIGDAQIAGEEGELKFQLWLPRSWRARKQSPDVFLDFMVEVTENGEPTARHFGVQVKGRRAKPENGKISVSMDTKHLRYYAECRDPVFIFRIDPDSGEGNWVFIQRYLKQPGMAEKLATQKTVNVNLDLGHNLGERELFNQELEEARKFMADEFPGSPKAAVEKRKEFLESLDPNFSVVDMTATEQGERMAIQARPGSGVAGPTIIGQFTPEHYQALDLGQSITLVASTLTADTPLIRQLLAELGEKDVTLAFGPSKTLSGSVQVSLEGVSDFGFQVNGEWAVWPKGFSFTASLAETPFRLKSVWNGIEPEDLLHPDMNLSFGYSVWAGQSLTCLAHFDDLKRLFENRAIVLRFMVRGREVYAGKVEVTALAASGWSADSVKWLEKLQQAAKFFNVDPEFPDEAKFETLTAVNARVLVSLATKGTYSQSSGENTFKVTARFRNTLKPYPAQISVYHYPNQYQDFDFLGVPVRVGPLTLTWTDFILASVVGLPDGQTVLTYNGGPSGRIRMTLNTPPAESGS